MLHFVYTIKKREAERMKRSQKAKVAQYQISLLTPLMCGKVVGSDMIRGGQQTGPRPASPTE